MNTFTFKTINEPIKIYSLTDELLEIYKIYSDSTNNWKLETIENPTIQKDDFYYIDFTIDEESYIIVKWNTQVEIIAVNQPKPLFVLYFEYEDNLSIKELNEDETTFNYLGNGIYIYEPKTLKDNLFYVKELEILKTATYPFNKILLSEYNFTEGLYQYNFYPKKDLTFDLESGRWVYKKDYNVRISDVAKQIAYENNFNIDYFKYFSELPENHIRNYIKYFRWYDDVNKRYLYYLPGFTPEDNINNFSLLDNEKIRGIELLTLKPFNFTIK